MLVPAHVFKNPTLNAETNNEQSVLCFNIIYIDSTRASDFLCVISEVGGACFIAYLAHNAIGIFF